MNRSKMEKKYPVLLGLSHGEQLEIVKRAMQEIHSARNERIIKCVIVMAIFVFFGLIRSLIHPSGFWAKTSSALIAGVMCYFVYTWYYGKRLQQKIKDLVHGSAD